MLFLAFFTLCLCDYDDADPVVDFFVGKEIKIFVSSFNHLHLAERYKDHKDDPLFVINKGVNANEFGYDDRAKVNRNGDGYMIKIGKDYLCVRDKKKVVFCGDNKTDNVWEINKQGLGFQFRKKNLCVTVGDNRTLSMQECTRTDDQIFDFKMFYSLDKCKEALEKEKELEGKSDKDKTKEKGKTDDKAKGDEKPKDKSDDKKEADAVAKDTQPDPTDEAGVHNAFPSSKLPNENVIPYIAPQGQGPIYVPAEAFGLPPQALPLTSTNAIRPVDLSYPPVKVGKHSMPRSSLYPDLSKEMAAMQPHKPELAGVMIQAQQPVRKKPDADCQTPIVAAVVEEPVGEKEKKAEKPVEIRHRNPYGIATKFQEFDLSKPKIRD